MTKRTRPAINQLFAALELSAEAYISLSGLAKTFMLDPAHPERMACVGDRNRTQGDAARLRLWGCVRALLDSDAGGGESVGDTFFAAQGRSYTWPEDAEMVIARLTPLVRRVVTNERQRRYAVATRAKDPKELATAEAEEASVVDNVPHADNMDVRILIYEQTAGDDKPDRLIDRLVIREEECATYDELSAVVKKRLGRFTNNLAINLHAHLPGGMASVDSSNAWNQALTTTRITPWMENTLKVIAIVGLAA